MKKILILLTSVFFLASTGGFVACSDNTDAPEVGLKLQPSKNQIKADGTDQVSFTVLLNGTDVTKEAAIWQLADDATGTELPSAAFATTTPGTYRFQARYTENGEALTSAIVPITATGNNGENKEVFFRRIFVQQFTSTGCPNCPLLNTALRHLEESETWNDRLVRATFHTNYRMVSDPMWLSLTDKYLSFYDQKGLPSFYADFIKDTHVTNVEKEVEAQLQRVRTDYPAVCGVAIESTYDEASREVNLTVKVTASETNEYRVLAFLVEDGIQAAQLEDATYIHDNTIRLGFSPSLLGDKLGTIEANQEATKSYSYTLRDTWKAENMRIVVCALNKVGNTMYGNNSATCSLGGTAGYKYN